MAELIQPFWLASARLSSPTDLPEWLKTNRIQARWLDEIMVTSGEDQIRFTTLPGQTESTPVIQIANRTGGELSLLQDACRKIETADRSMILLIGEAQQETIALLLASPAKVGALNLIPLAYMESRVSLHISSNEMDILGRLAAEFKQKEKLVGQLGHLSVTSSSVKRPVKTNSPFANAVWTKQELNALAGCHELVASLTSSKKKQGLAVEIDEKKDLYATWVEGL